MNLLDYLILLVAEVCRIFWGRDSLAHLFLGKHIIKATKKNKYSSLKNLTDKMTNKAKAPHLNVYVIHDKYPNACTIWDIKKHYILGVTTGELTLDTAGELKATLGHEIGHYWARPGRKFHKINVWSSAILISLIGVFAILRYNSSITNIITLTIVIIVMISMICFILYLFHYQRKCELEADIIGAKLSSVTDSINSLKHDSAVIHRIAKSHFLTQNYLKKLINHLLYNPVMNFFNRLLQDHPTNKQRIHNLENFAKHQKVQQR